MSVLVEPLKHQRTVKSKAHGDIAHLVFESAMMRWIRVGMFHILERTSALHNKITVLKDKIVSDQVNIFCLRYKFSL